MKLTPDTATLIAEQFPDLADLATALADAARGWLEPDVTDPTLADAARVSYAVTCEALLEDFGCWLLRCADLTGDDAGELLRDFARILDERTAAHAEQ